MEIPEILRFAQDDILSLDVGAWDLVLVYLPSGGTGGGLGGNGSGGGIGVGGAGLGGAG